MYQCIACQRNLIDESLSTLTCSHCGNCYPVINGVGIFLLPDVFSSLEGFILEVEETKSSFSKISNKLDDFALNSDDAKLLNRIGVIKKGLAGNVRILDDSCQPIMDYLKKCSRPDTTFAWCSVKSGFTFHDMLPYFYQDWSGTPDFSEVKDLFGKILTEHCKDKESVAVLGAGACGLIHSVANEFQMSYAVDLSLQTLLTAKQFIEGEPLSFHLQKADWHKVELTPPQLTTNDIRYVVSDVMNMPFENDSLSVVITQYMLDFVSNPKRLTDEIYRVLKPDGLWINFSIPFKVPEEPLEMGSRKLDELPSFFNKLGFDVVSLEAKRFNLLNLEKVYADSGNHTQLVHFFTLRKNNKKCSGNDEKPICRFFKKNDSIWRENPLVVKGRELTFAQKESFVTDGRRIEHIEISLIGHSFSIPKDFAMLLKTFFDCVDGKNTLRVIYVDLQEKGINLSEEAFLQLIYVLHVQHYLIELKTGID